MLLHSFSQVCLFKDRHSTCISIENNLEITDVYIKIPKIVEMYLLTPYK